MPMRHDGVWPRAVVRWCLARSGYTMAMHNSCSSPISDPATAAAVAVDPAVAPWMGSGGPSSVLAFLFF